MAGAWEEELEGGRERERDRELEVGRKKWREEESNRQNVQT